jgi:hypothetical protein
VADDLAGGPGGVPPVVPPSAQDGWRKFCSSGEPVPEGILEKMTREELVELRLQMTKYFYTSRFDPNEPTPAPSPVAEVAPSLLDLRCPTCGALAVDLDDLEAWCDGGHVWELSCPSENYYGVLLGALADHETRKSQSDLEGLGRRR